MVEQNTQKVIEGNKGSRFHQFEFEGPVHGGWEIIIDLDLLANQPGRIIRLPVIIPIDLMYDPIMPV